MKNTKTVGTNNVLHIGWFNIEIPAIIPTTPDRSFQPHMELSMNIPINEKIPLLAFIGRLAAKQKGLDILYEALVKLLPEEDLQFVLLGKGDKAWEQKFTKLEGRMKRSDSRLRVLIRFDEPLAHRIYAGADFLIVPSKFEPCGLNQLYSLKYGTIPIVRSTGGLADTIKNYTPETGRGYGFVFDDYSSKALLQVVKKAIELFKNQDTWKKLINRAMKQDFSWSKAAEKYVELYNSMNIQ